MKKAIIATMIIAAICTLSACTVVVGGSNTAIATADATTVPPVSAAGFTTQEGMPEFAVISGGARLLPMHMSSLYACSGGACAYNYRYQPAELAGMLAAAEPFACDTDARIESGAFSVNYALYEAGELTLIGRGSDMPSDVAPGEYLLVLEAKWGDETDYTGYQLAYRLIYR